MKFNINIRGGGQSSSFGILALNDILLVRKEVLESIVSIFYRDSSVQK